MLKKILSACLLIILCSCNNNNKPIILNNNETIKIIDPSAKIVALTFDDGPSIYTKEIIELLKENDACATFFVVGNKIEAYSNTINLMIKNGNEIGNHSYSHKWLSRLSSNKIIEEITLTQNILKNNFNYTSKLLRPTYGEVNKKLRKATDLSIILWNVDTKDWRIKSSEQIAKRALNSIDNYDIVLMHDIYERTLNALKIIIPSLKNEGYQFVTISELENIKEIKKEIKG